MRDLRLCLGHAGGEDFWLGKGKFTDWGQRVYKLCTLYPNVYCEFGIHGEIVDEKARATFVDTVVGLIEASRRAPNQIDFAKKIMYGSDWFMPMSKIKGRENYLKGFQAAALAIEKRLGGEPGFYEDFMYRNALKYLDAARRQNDRNLPQALQDNLARLVTHSGR